jgi:C-terminal processing protease CtpA/Prc
MALQTQHHVTHVGTTTFGAFSPRITRPMINGWFYSISVDRVTDMDGVCHEGIGIIPAIKLTNDLEDGEIRSDHPDRQLERVLEEVKKWLDKLP